ncbi:prefoldin subunit 5 [Metabacillus malikii]|uniref:Prefoldin subunit 5 n=1 Tax=Metabacillus malikii TaxID=1504265 RepID=A0ABT9ZFK2_9BACI|nr:prefoldin subunit 5 [Metabacillus malikii]
MSYLQSELAEKKEQLERLKSCATELDGYQAEFSQNQHLVKDPDLSGTTWKGNLADKFIDIREDMEGVYKDLSGYQLDTAITAIENKIATIKAEIQSLQVAISAEIARIEREEREERERERAKARNK